MELKDVVLMGAFALLIGLILGLMFSIIYGRSTVLTPSEPTTSSGGSMVSTIIFIVIAIVSILIILNTFKNA